MQNNNRASLFAPFDALKGLNEALRRVEQNKENKKELSDDLNNILNEKISKLIPNSKIKVEYYVGINYMEVIDVFKKVDSITHKLYLKNSIIDFDDIYDINEII